MRVHDDCADLCVHVRAGRRVHDRAAGLVHEPASGLVQDDRVTRGPRG
ncbi:hypothetical protein ACIPIU_29520 [Streptomyces massasporeus]